MKKILLINQFNSDNLGDKLLNDMIKKELKEACFDVINIGYAQQKKQDIAIKNTKNNLLNILKKHLPNYLKFIIKYKRDIIIKFKTISKNEIKFIVIGGGQLLKHKSVFIYCLNLWVKLAIKNNIPIALYGIGVDSNLNNREIRLYKRILNKIEYINCRDKKSKDYLKKLCGKDINVSPDIAFSYKPNNLNHKKQKEIIIMPYYYFGLKDKFNITVNKNEYYSFFLKKINDYSEYKIILTATTSADLKECYDLRNYLSYNNINSEVKIAEKYAELSTVLCRGSILITGRMHAMIMGMINECHVIPLEISEKIKEFKKEYLIKNVNINNISDKAVLGVKKMINFMEEKNETID